MVVVVVPVEVSPSFESTVSTSAARVMNAPVERTTRMNISSALLLPPPPRPRPKPTDARRDIETLTENLGSETFSSSFIFRMMMVMRERGFVFLSVCVYVFGTREACCLLDERARLLLLWISLHSGNRLFELFCRTTFLIFSSSTRTTRALHWTSWRH